MNIAKDGAKLQNYLFELIKKQLAPNITLVDTVADLLEISNDSAYRRLRGETLLNIGELMLLCNHFKLSIDALNTQLADSVNFKYRPLPADDSSLPLYLNGILDEMKQINSVANKQIIFTSEDLPIFHYFKYDLLTAFKLYYWNKSILNSPQYNGKKFNPTLVDPAMTQTAKEIYELYVKIPSIEVWTEDTISIILKQVEFYWESGLFEQTEHAVAVCDQLKDMIDTVQKDAELGSKERDRGHNAQPNYILYQSDVTIGNNCIQVTMNDVKLIYFSFNTFNSMSTTNHAFCEETDLWIKNLISKSTQISGVSEKLRYQFFNALHKRLSLLRQKIES
jgi:hypothetical protein